jgi:hypothetical protein
MDEVPPEFVGRGGDIYTVMGNGTRLVDEIRRKVPPDFIHQSVVLWCGTNAWLPSVGIGPPGGHWPSIPNRAI